MKISVVGVGKLGAVLAAVLADSGEEVIGVDVHPAVVCAINEHRAPVREPGLDELILKNAARLSATTDLEAAVADSEITFVVLPTPSLVDGTFSVDYVLSAVETIGKALRPKQGYHLVVISSTLMPGSMEGRVLPLLESVSGKSCGRDFGLCYNPEFIALGTVIRDMSNPDLILIGESDPEAGAKLERLYARICKNNPPVVRMNFVNAELTKISVNSFVTMKISYANTLSEICGKVDGADAAMVLKAVGLDGRIGSKYLQGALGYGGPCFPRDNAAFSRFAKQNGVEASLADAADRVNQRQVEQLGNRILDLLPEEGTAGILGLSYKPDTDVIEESQGVLLAEYLIGANCDVIVYDPLALENAKRELGGRVRYAASMEECAGAASVVTIATAWNEFRALRPAHLKGDSIVIDCWRILPKNMFAFYETCGRGYRKPAGRNSPQATTAA
jgi:UDPglucose 6-dehydrogenase